MNVYKPQHVVNGNEVAEDLVNCPFREVITKLLTEKDKLERFLKEVKEARSMEHSMLSPVAGILEQGQLDFINEVLGLKE